MNSIISTVFIILSFQAHAYCTKAYKGRNEVSGQILNPSKHYHTNSNTISSTYSPENTKLASAKKWQVGRVSRKHYEIVNMLWKKTKIFIDPESTTTETNSRKNSLRISKLTPHVITSLLSLPQSSTSSYIEFYYLDDNDDRVKKRDSVVPRKNEMNINANRSLGNKRNPIVSFHINDSVSKKISSTATQLPKRIFEKLNKKSKIFRQSHPLYDFLLSRLESKISNVRNTKPTIDFNIGFEFFKKSSQYETCPTTTDKLRYNTSLLQTTILDSSNDFKSFLSTTTPYDKIKFFETYDKQTEISTNGRNKQNIFNINIDNMIQDYRDNKTLILEDINNGIGHHDGLNQKLVKKHVEKDFHSDIDTHNILEKKIKSHTMKNHQNEPRRANVSDEQNSKYNQNILKDEKIYNQIQIEARNTSRLALSSEYPFTAVYIYEPLQILCDAAALNPHWLLTAGSCLSRSLRKDPMIGRSAFVVYCSENWWESERVSYVKYSVVHPRYHPKEDMRRYLYNIGLVQVVGSMASCSGWAPISLMSHHYAAGTVGTIATAVGWGLDRYDVRYSLSNLPQKPLSVYDGIIYSTSCPGNKQYSKLKSLNEDITKNIYCLRLPYYDGEENDPVHGSLLLVGGKLIALYIQEERRAKGVQSALYTGIWRLVPWIHEVAREYEDSDVLGVEM